MDGQAAAISTADLRPAIVRSLEQRPDVFAETHVNPDLQTVLVAALGPAGAPSRAVLALGPAPGDRFTADVRARVSALVTWAGEVLARADDHAAVREALRRESVLRDAAAALAGTSALTVAVAAVASAARQALSARASVVDRASGETIAGEHHWSGPADPERAPVTRRLASDLALLMDREERGLQPEERAWLETLCALATPAVRRCRAVERLAEERRRLRTTIDAAPVPLLVLGDDRRPIRSNAAFRALDVDPATLDPRALPEELQVGDPARTFVVVAMPLDAVEPGAQTIALREITRERQALQAKEDLIATMGHELRTPLTSVLGYSRIMERHLGVVNDQVQRLNEIIEGFVDASRANGGVVPARRAILDPADLVHEAAARFRGAHEDRDLRVTVAPAPPIMGDRAWLGQVLDNLLENAAKYSSSDRPVELFAAGRGNEALLSVRDRGSGIPAHELNRIFERSYRATDDRTVQGQGLGLSIVHDLVSAHGGRVWAESAGPGRGTTFHVSLPAMLVDEADEATSTGEHAESRADR